MNKLGRNLMGVLALVVLFLALVAALLSANAVNEFTVGAALVLMLIPALLIFKTIPTYYIGQVTRFEERVTGILGEGIVAIIPFIEEINIIFAGRKRMILGEGTDLFVTPVVATEYTTKLEKAEKLVKDGVIYFEVIAEAFFETSNPDAALGVGGGDQALNDSVEHQIKSRVRSYTQGKKDSEMINLKDDLAKTVLEELTLPNKPGEVEREALHLAGQSVLNVVIRIVQKPKSLRDADEEAVKQLAQLPGEQADAASLREEALALMAPANQGGLNINDPQFAVLAALSRKNTPGVILVYGGDPATRQAAVWNQGQQGSQRPTPPPIPPPTT